MIMVEKWLPTFPYLFSDIFNIHAFREPFVH